LPAIAGQTELLGHKNPSHNQPKDENGGNDRSDLHGCQNPPMTIVVSPVRENRGNVRSENTRETGNRGESEGGIKWDEHWTALRDHSDRRLSIKKTIHPYRRT
jgi:hypothetical protein